MAGLNQNLVVERDRFNAAMAAEDTDVAPVIVGEAADLAQVRRSAQETLHDIMVQTEDHLRRLSEFVAPIKEEKE